MGLSDPIRSGPIAPAIALTIAGAPAMLRAPGAALHITSIMSDNPVAVGNLRAIDPRPARGAFEARRIAVISDRFTWYAEDRDVARIEDDAIVAGRTPLTARAHRRCSFRARRSRHWD